MKGHVILQVSGEDVDVDARLGGELLGAIQGAHPGARVMGIDVGGGSGGGSTVRTVASASADIVGDLFGPHRELLGSFQMDIISPSGGGDKEVIAGAVAVMGAMDPNAMQEEVRARVDVEGEAVFLVPAGAALGVAQSVVRHMIENEITDVTVVEVTFDPPAGSSGAGDV